MSTTSQTEAFTSEGTPYRSPMEMALNPTEQRHVAQVARDGLAPLAIVLSERQVELLRVNGCCNAEAAGTRLRFTVVVNRPYRDVAAKEGK